jgi:predicted kinase
VQYTEGAELHEDLNTSEINHIQLKGLHPSLDSYSGFRDNEGSNLTGLHKYITDRCGEAPEIDVCGLLTNRCVKFNALDAKELIPKSKVSFIEDASMARKLENVKAAKMEMERAGIISTTSSTIIDRAAGNLSNPEILMLVGVSGSGKSTFRKDFISKNKAYYVLNIDEIRDEYAKKHGLTFEQLFEPEHHSWSHNEFERQLKSALNQRLNIVIDRTNLKVEDRHRILSLVPPEYKKTAVYFTCDKEEIMKRQLARDEQFVAQGKPSQNIPESVIEQMLADYKQPSESEGFNEVFSNRIFLLGKQRSGFRE